MFRANIEFHETLFSKTGNHYLTEFDKAVCPSDFMGCDFIAWRIRVISGRRGTSTG